MASMLYHWRLLLEDFFRWVAGKKSRRADFCVYVLVVPVSENNLSESVRCPRFLSKKLFEVGVCPKKSLTLTIGVMFFVSSIWHLTFLRDTYTYRIPTSYSVVFQKTIDIKFTSCFLKKILDSCVCSTKLAVVRSNTESVFGQARNSEILDCVWHL